MLRQCPHVTRIASHIRSSDPYQWASKPSPCRVNLTGFNLLFVQCMGVRHGVNIRPLDLPVVSGISLCTRALFSCIAWLRLVHSCDILHTKFIGCNQACLCQVKLDQCVTHSFSFIPVTERVKGCRLQQHSNTNRQSTFMGWLVMTVALGGNHYLRIRLWSN